MLGLNLKIKKILCMIASTFCIVAAAETFITFQVSASDIVVVNTTDVNVRSNPSTSSKIYGKVNTGTFLTRYENRSDGWSCIDYAGVKAYIKNDFLTPYVGTIAYASDLSNGATTTAGVQNSTLPAVTSSATSVSSMVWIPQSGAKYHKNSSCSNMKNPSQISLSDAQARGYTACKKCYK